MHTEATSNQPYADKNEKETSRTSSINSDRQRVLALELRVNELSRERNLLLQQIEREDREALQQ